ncbi:hypothetical protein SELMODRAFT_447836 [Selaginella moellendorffii]|uniref:Uncharacterized protein n=1 Tax=Selaginella moellendorffii TaxID=88036 RepID=D8T2M8_SELML|nr:hypothetical protein SELMODRAFT_432567 [Selaginella moellendorffii]EFJ09132.1 hypothetical protein SELMODRAFT_447832 [Selaginella moellendorffii]EFJ09136.1 hypothetical protein SELMODRAFT_447836 [Selaginella moellendorffii]
MALPLLMNNNEFNHALEVFRNVSSNSKAVSRARFLHVDAHVATDVDVYIPVAIAVNAPPLPGANAEVYKLPKFHVHALATFTAVGMQLAHYSPKLITDPAEASQQAKHFQQFLTVLVTTFPQYVYLTAAASEDMSGSCDTIWKDVSDYLQRTHDTETANQITKTLQKALLHVPTFAHVEDNTSVRALYTLFSFRSPATNPELNMYWADATMTKKAGKITTWEATITITSFTAKLNSNSLAADANALAKEISHPRCSLLILSNPSPNPECFTIPSSPIQYHSYVVLLHTSLQESSTPFQWPGGLTKLSNPHTFASGSPGESKPELLKEFRRESLSRIRSRKGKNKSRLLVCSQGVCRSSRGSNSRTPSPGCRSWHSVKGIKRAVKGHKGSGRSRQDKKAKDEALLRLEAEKLAREKAEAAAKQRVERIQRKSEADLRAHRDEIHKLEQEVCKLKLSARELSLSMDLSEQDAVAMCYGCFLDVLGRAGRLEIAEDMICNMPFEPSACKTHSDIARALRVTNYINHFAPDKKTQSCMLLANTYAAWWLWTRAIGLATRAGDERALEEFFEELEQEQEAIEIS